MGKLTDKQKEKVSEKIRKLKIKQERWESIGSYYEGKADGAEEEIYQLEETL